MMGRLTLNPIPHIDLIVIVVPLFSLLAAGSVFIARETGAGGSAQLRAPGGTTCWCRGRAGVQHLPGAGVQRRGDPAGHG
jgi:hypothetical protein